MNKKKQIVGLDLIRFAAACSVLLHHLGWLAFVGKPQPFRHAATFFVPGWIGVEIFFVMSGFVIAFSAARGSAGSFIRSRVIRLYPAAWICSTCTFVIASVVGRYPVRALFWPWMHSVFLLPNSTWIDSVYWTLGIECVFYALVLAHLLLGKYHALGKTFSALALLSTLFWVYMLFRRNTLASAGYDVSSFAPGSGISLLQHGCFFAIGVLAWLLLLDRITWSRLLGLAFAIPGASIEIWFHAAWMRSFFHVSGRAYVWWTPLLMWIAAMIVMVFAVKRNDWVTSRLRDRGVSIARSLGLVTYPLYLIHQRCGYILLHRLTSLVPPAVALGAVCFGAFVAAWFIAFQAEVPLQRKLAGILHRRFDAREVPAASTP